MGPFSIGTLSTGSKNGVPFFGPRFGRRSTATTFTLELAFGTMKSGRGSKKQCQMQSDNLYDYMWHPVIFAQLQPKRAGWFQLAACTHVRAGSCTLQQLWRPICKGTFSTGFSGLVNEPAKPSKTVGHSIETISTGVALCFYGYGRNHVGTMNAISGILGAGHGQDVRQNRRLPPCQNLYTVCADVCL